MKNVDELVATLNERLEHHSREPFSVDERESPTTKGMVFRLSDLVTEGELSGDFVRRVFRAILKRDPDDEGLAYYAGELDSGKRERRQLVVELLFCDEGRQVGCAVIGLSSTDEVQSVLVENVLRVGASLSRLETEINIMAARLQRIPKSQIILLQAVEEYLRFFTEAERPESASKGAMASSAAVKLDQDHDKRGDAPAAVGRKRPKS